ncbi:MAG: YcaO-like family protein, partial [Minisyncoccota bacterium]
IFEGIPFSQILSPTRGTFKERAIYSILDILERKLGVTITYDARRIPFNRPELLGSFELFNTLQRHGILDTLIPIPKLVDESPLALWTAKCGDKNKSPVGGAAWNDDAHALTATIAEGLERYVWLEEQDYFVAPLRETRAGMRKHGAFFAPERFVGFSTAQRSGNPRWKFDSSDIFSWTRGISLVSGSPVYVPVQTISGMHYPELSQEPMIRERTTTGLATWPTQTGARLAGAIEVIERDAYMIMWLNQLSLPRISLDSLRARSASLSDFIDSCERYRLKIHVVQMLTDAPTHAICVVIEDQSGHAPRFSIGLGAHRVLTHAVEKSLTEAMRARFSHRRQAAAGKIWDSNTPVSKVRHFDRIPYWGVPEHAKKLEFLIAGRVIDVPPAAWEDDTPEEHLARVVDWCRNSEYECLSVSLGTSKKNCTQWSIEMVVIPELQPMYLEERFQTFGGERLRTVPKKYGFTPRAEPYAETPHPFA